MPGRILVAAGTNGAGKSSIVQPLIRSNGGFYFNPDEETKKFVKAGFALEEANAAAWTKSLEMLKAAIDEGLNHAFETTLGGSTIAYELMRALAMEREVNIVYVGLESVDLHIQRVAERVLRGGHDIPEDKIRTRYNASRKNLLSFIGTRATIAVWDNSDENLDGSPHPRLMFKMINRRLQLPASHDPATVPDWVKPLLQRAQRFS